VVPAWYRRSISLLVPAVLPLAGKRYTRRPRNGACSPSDPLCNLSPGDRTVEKIKVLVANRPRLMRELVLETISSQPDIEVMAEIQDDSKIEQLVGELHPDCLIIALDESDSRPDICDSLLERYPHLKILALAAERNSSIYYWATLSIRSNRVETSEQGILNALRGRAPMASVTALPTGGQKVN